jgi:PAS domain S-box-containing protein
MQLSNSEKPSILIVDDEPQVASALADVLEEQFSVVTETSPRNAIEILESNKRISVIISDQRMPGMTGDEFFARAIRISPATRILITAYADISAVIDAVNQGKIFAYVTKPWQPDDIVLTVNRAAEYSELNRMILHEQQLLHQLMESSLDAIAIKDRNHTYIKLNRQEAKILGAKDTALVEGRTAADFLPPERLQLRQRDEAELYRTGLPVRERVERVVLNGTQVRWYSSNMAPIKDLQGDIVGTVGITRDITESKRLDDMKDQFIATVRHELRSPLTAIHGALALLRGGMVEQNRDKVERLIEIGHENCGRLIVLINDLLDTVNIEKGDVKFDYAPLDIANLVASAADAGMEAAEKKGITILVDTNLPHIEIDADRARMLQVLDKLMSNAIDLTPAGGEIRLQARRVENGKVRVSVLDQGPGVPDEVSQLLFKRFSQGDSSNARQKGGVGLGLYIAKSIVDAHKGKIGFVNQQGRGAEFYFELPILHATAARNAVAARRHG